ncbi:MAG: coproporphyrinogen dehydrogenase HemZ [Firmicutes bacterium]|nr:coproporphyrinogen dehydrogenase HemZ [Bacillota bacterium]
MYNFIIKNVSNKYDCEELIKVFIPADDFRAWTEAEWLGMTDEEREQWLGLEQVIFNETLSNDKNAVKREILRHMSLITGTNPSWGILTGVRPVKLTGEIFDRLESEEAVRRELKETYLLDDEKTDLLIDTYNYQQEICGKPDPKSAGIYIGIPFCPTRCLYCSFTSNQVGESEIARYLEALKKEIAYVGKRMQETGIWAESIYIGGGTPTTLSAEQLDELIASVKENMDLSRCREFTVEAGRPDTITYEKLEAIKKHGIERISINPQSMKEKTLELIGRSHKPGEIVQAFQKADWVGIPMVNADLIAGLPEEEPEDFDDTMKRILDLDPENITVHTLAVKRASRLIDVDKDFHFKQAERVKKMLAGGKEQLKKAGFRPYYLYRQKNMAGSFENVGYCKEGTPCIYNIRIMEEKQIIIALGAGGISKMYYPDENRLERVPNVSNYEIYISRLEEMLERKEKNIFMEVM